MSDVFEGCDSRAQVDDRWRYCPEGYRFLLWQMEQGGSLSMRSPSDLELLRTWLARGYVFTRQGRERLDQLEARELEEQAAALRLGPVQPPQPLRGSTYLDAGFVYCPYIPEGIE